MKKLPFVLMTLVGFILLTGCKKDPTPEPTPTYADPTLTLTTSSTGMVGEGDEIVAGTAFAVAFTGTGETVAKLEITIKADDEVVFEDTKEYDNETIIQYAEVLTLNTIGDITMTAVLTDTQGKTATVTVHFKIIASSTTGIEGTYSGPAVLNGVAEVQGLASYTMPADTSMLTVTITHIEADRYEGRFVYENEEHVTTGILRGDELDFEPFDREIEVLQEAFNLNLTLTFNFEAKCIEDLLNVHAVVTGTGNIVIPGMPIAMPCSFNGDVSGNLEKTE